MIEGCWCVVNDKKKVAKNLWSETDVNRVIGNIYKIKNYWRKNNGRQKRINKKALLTIKKNVVDMMNAKMDNA